MSKCVEPRNDTKLCKETARCATPVHLHRDVRDLSERADIRRSAVFDCVTTTGFVYGNHYSVWLLG
jgi:hypothetical protein